MPRLLPRWNTPQKILTGLVLVVSVASMLMLLTGSPMVDPRVHGLILLTVIAAVVYALRGWGIAADHDRVRLIRLEEENRLLLMTEATAHIGHWRVDFRSDDVFWSDETFRIYGLLPGEEPDLEAAIAAFHPEDRELVGTAVETARATGKPFNFQARLVRPDGELRITESIALVEYGPDGEPAAIFGVFADRTDEVKLRNELVAARDAADAAGRSKSAFLANMSHEIRTPMNGVVGFADMLLRSDLPEQQHRYAGLIAESGKTMMQLLNDILDLSKIEAGEMTVAKTVVDLPHLVKQCMRLIEPQAREKGLAVEMFVDPSVPQNYLGDPLRIRQILCNLLNNAIKFTGSGSVGLSITTTDDEVIIRVTDTGIGIAPDRQEMIFSAFTQADVTTAAEHGGTGLGLAICQQLTQMMDGEIALESTPGIGSTVTITLPALYGKVEHADGSRNVAAVASGARFAGHRVLLAEDYDINQMLMAAMAADCGLDLDIAGDGSEAVAMVGKAAAEGRPYALILMDLQMPKLCGIDAARVLRDTGYDARDLPIVALTANAFPEDIDACLAAGMQAHLAKPLSFETFTRETGRWLAQDRRAA
ncbi:ATP-binding protein [Alteripontixanthobacter maritimus]|nr:ATP-binding protein [Alteripontixanthobacter maritimus]